MTLWFDAGTIRTEYVQVEENPTDTPTFRERVVDGQPQVEVLIPPSTAFQIDSASFLREFRGGNADIDIESSHGTAEITELSGMTEEQSMAFRPAKMCRVVFSADDAATGTDFAQRG